MLYRASDETYSAHLWATTWCRLSPQAAKQIRQLLLRQLLLRQLLLRQLLLRQLLLRHVLLLILRHKMKTSLVYLVM